jgi:hypothetical protein
MTENPKALIVIGQVLADPWLSITREGQFPTWLPIAEELGVPVRHSHGNQPSKLLQAMDHAHEKARWHPYGKKIVPLVDNAFTRPFRGHIQHVEKTDFLTAAGGGWHQNLPDVYVLQRWKILGSLQTSLTEEYDYVYFTTASSYVRVDELLRRIGMLPSSGVYAGTRMMNGYAGDEFASGASRILSRDVVEEVLRHSKLYANDVMEDVGLGRLLRDLDVDLIPLPSINITSMSDLQRLTDEQLREHFHFRLTSGTRENRQDVELMRALHARLS